MLQAQDCCLEPGQIDLGPVLAVKQQQQAGDHLASAQDCPVQAVSLSTGSFVHWDPQAT